MLHDHVAHTFLTLEDLLEQNVILILDPICVRGQVLGQLLHGEIYSLRIVVTKFLLQTLLELELVIVETTRVVLLDLTCEYIAKIHVVADFLDRGERYGVEDVRV